MSSTVQSDKRSKTRPAFELRVVFDTNVLLTKSPLEFVRQAVVEVLTRRHPDINVKWFIPDIVRHERQYQMQEKARELLPSLDKLEKLLGHHLGITEDIVLRRVDENVSRQLTTLGLQELKLDRTGVDWERLTLDAAYRRAPFEAGEKEKGFRDAIIAETFLQLVEGSPKTTRLCRIVLVTEDQRLASAVKERVKDRPNARVVPSLDELSGLINTLSAEVTEDFISKYRMQAQELFWGQDIINSLVEKEKIIDTLTERFHAILEQVPTGAHRRKNRTWHVDSPPTFVRKSGQRVTWRNVVVVDTEAMRFVTSDGSLVVYQGDQPNVFRRAAGPVVYSPTGQVMELTDVWTRARGVKRQKVVAHGHEAFEVIWSVSISTRGNLSAPRIEDLSHVETVWENSDPE